MTAQAQDDDAELVEQVARAICEANGEDCIQDNGFPEWRKYKPDARAAIKAIRLSVTTPDTTVLVERELRQKLRMIISHASGGHLSEPDDVNRSTNDICVEISRHNNHIWEHAQEVALRDAALSSTADPTGETSNG